MFARDWALAYGTQNRFHVSSQPQLVQLPGRLIDGCLSRFVLVVFVIILAEVFFQPPTSPLLQTSLLPSTSVFRAPRSFVSVQSLSSALLLLLMLLLLLLPPLLPQPPPPLLLVLVLVLVLLLLLALLFPLFLSVVSLQLLLPPLP